MFPTNPYKQALHKFVYEMLKDRYKSHDELVERIGSYFVTEKDTTAICKLLVDVFECGFLKATNEYKEQLKGMGLTVRVVAEKTT